MKEFEFEPQLRSVAQRMEYPSTPDIAGQLVMRLRPSARPRFAFRKLAWSLTIGLVLISSLMLIPTARAAIIEFIQIGIVRIIPQSIQPPVDAISTATPEDSQSSLIPLLNEIAGETDLRQAQEIAPYQIMLPTYPSDLVQPNHVYIQDVEGMMTILIWMDSQQPGRVRMSLHFIPTGHWAINKFGPTIIQETEVNAQSAIWAVGSYPLFLQNGDIEIMRLIEGHVLIWADGEMTYRLETDLDLEEAIKIAESLEPEP